TSTRSARAPPKPRTPALPTPPPGRIPTLAAPRRAPPRERGNLMSTAAPEAPASSEAPTELPPVKRRNAELALIGVATVITMSAMAIAGLNLNGQLPGAMWGYGLLFGAMALATHAALRWIAPYADPLILPCALFLNGIGVA